MKLTDFEDSVFDMLHSMAEKNSKCIRRKNAAAVVSEDAGVISMGYNGPPRKMRHCDEMGCLRSMLPGIISGDMLHICSAVHSEENAIINAGRQGKSCIGASLFTLYSPCYHCSKLAINAGITRIVAWEEYTDPFGHSLLLQASDEIGLQYVVLSEEKEPQFNSIIILGAGTRVRKELACQIVNWFPKCVIVDVNRLHGVEGDKDTYNFANGLINRKEVPVMMHGFLNDAAVWSVETNGQKFDKNAKELIHLRRMYDPLIRPLYILWRDIADPQEYERHAYAILETERIKYWDCVAGSLAQSKHLTFTKEHIDKRIRNVKNA